MDPRPRLTIPLTICLLAIAFPQARPRAELIYLRAGGGMQVPAAIEGDRITLELPDGRASFLREDFEAIIPGFNPGSEWPRRIEKARRDGTAARFATAWWALENGLVSHAETEFRSLHRDDPKHPSAARIVAALDRLRAPSVEPANLAEFEHALGVSMTRAAGPHVLLLHQHPEAEARERIELLEQIVTSYYILLAGQGIELPAPTTRLVSAWFADRSDYLAFLHSENADAFKTTRGYFHPTWNAVVAYDDRSGEYQRSARQALDARRVELERSSDAIAKLPRNGGRGRIRVGGDPPRMMTVAEAEAKRGRLEREIRLGEILLDFERRAIDLGTATHETIHQLTANTGLISRHDAFPIWMHEGFAAQFEVIRGGRWAGISRAHDLRLPDWRKIHPPPKLEPLIRDAGYGKGYQRDLYAQAWALVYFLRTRHPDEFLKFLDLLRAPDIERGAGDDGAPARTPLSPGQRASAAFHRAFGDDLGSLEAEWRATLDAARTPLERNAPARKSTGP